MPFHFIQAKQSFDCHLWRIILSFSVLLSRSSGTNTDAILLLSFKYSVLSDPLGVLDSWCYSDETPCSWNGVTCDKSDTYYHVIGLSLPNSRLLGSIPAELGSIPHLRNLDLSSNLINGSLPPNFGGSNLRYLNVSYNRLSGEIPLQFGNDIPANATVDISFNNFAGEIPESAVFFNQDTKSFYGNPELCGKPLKNPCPISTTVPTYPPATAAIPETTSPGTPNGSQQVRNGLGAGKIVGIVVSNFAGIGVVALILTYVYQLKTKKSVERTKGTEHKCMPSWGCLVKQHNGEEESSEATSSESKDDGQKGRVEEEEKGSGSVVMVDGEKELELETLLRASAYMLGASGSSIMYKTVLEDGTTMAVRRIGENGVERFRDFENQVRVIAKLVHPNLVRIRGFYWGADEKLVIYDFVPNGSLLNARSRKLGLSPYPLPWQVRLKIARGVARGLTYIHEKKHVHGNLKPSNILLGSDMEPKIGDFGLERLVTGWNSSKVSGSTRYFGSNRSTASRDSFQDIANGSTLSPSPSSLGCVSPYYAPESLRSLKPNPKWDVYSFGVVLLELVTGKVMVSDELGLGTAALGVEENSRVLRMADVAIRADMEGKEDALLALLKLGNSCISPIPQKRPPMKEVLQVLEKFPSSSSSSSYY